jgi:ATP/maltotriose-dependent transcriptional regulator MalT
VPTSREAQIARLATAECANPEIGAVLFLSLRTVDWHLWKISITPHRLAA